MNFAISKWQGKHDFQVNMIYVSRQTRIAFCENKQKGQIIENFVATVTGGIKIFNPRRFSRQGEINRERREFPI